MKRINFEKINYIGILAAVLCILVPCIFDKLYYYIADDYLMNLIIKGEFGTSPDPFLVFNSIFLGYILKVFYLVCPEINWYPIFQLVTIISCFIVLNLIFIKVIKNNSWKILFLTSSLELIVVYHLTFTIISYLCIGTALVYLIYIAERKEEIKQRDRIIVLALLVWGEWWRYLTVVTGIIPFIVILTWFIYKKRRRYIVSTLLAGIALIGISRLSENFIYNNTEVMGESYRKYNELRSQVVDFPRLNYEQYQSELAELGISENDWKCLYSWIFADKEIFSIEVLEKIVELQPKTERYNLNIKSILYGMISLKYNYWFLIILFVSLILTEHEYRKINILSAFCTYGLIAALFIRQRTVLRVMIPLYIMGILALLIWTVIYKNPRCKIIRRYEKFVCEGIAIIVAFCVLKDHEIEKQRYQEEYNKYTDLKTYLSENSQNLYISGSGLINPLEYSTDIFGVGNDIEVKNIMKLGSWDIYSKRYYDQIEAFGVEHESSLLKALSEENIYYMDYDEEIMTMIRKYFEEHVDEEVSWNVVRNFEDIGVKIVDISLQE